MCSLKGEVGYVFSSALVEFSDSLAAIMKEQSIADKKWKEKHAPDTSKYRRYIYVGMTMQNLIWLKGYPTKKNISVYGSTRIEQWIYSDKLYVYLSAGKVTSYQKFQ
jgi:hypothetical protein